MQLTYEVAELNRERHIALYLELAAHERGDPGHLATAQVLPAVYRAGEGGLGLISSVEAHGKVDGGAVGAGQGEHQGSFHVVDLVEAGAVGHLVDVGEHVDGAGQLAGHRIAPGALVHVQGDHRVAHGTLYHLEFLGILDDYAPGLRLVARDVEHDLRLGVVHA